MRGLAFVVDIARVSSRLLLTARFFLVPQTIVGLALFHVREVIFEDRADLVSLPRDARREVNAPFVTAGVEQRFELGNYRWGRLRQALLKLSQSRFRIGRELSPIPTAPSVDHVGKQAALEFCVFTGELHGGAQLRLHAYPYFGEGLMEEMRDLQILSGQILQSRIGRRRSG